MIYTLILSLMSGIVDGHAGGKPCPAPVRSCGRHSTLTGEAAKTNPADVIVLIHGLGRTRLSLNWLARQFQAAGYSVVNLGYPSTRLNVSSAARQLRHRLDAHWGDKERALHFVTHSLGGIVVRAMLRDERPANLGRVVMLAPPNQGSEVVDRLARVAPYRWVTGPAGQELGTGSESTPNQLGPVDYPVGVIAGRASLNPLLSAWLKGPNDGKVSVARTTVEGVQDVFVVHRSHTFLMRSREVATQALHFIARGQFHRPAS
jgi:triacylglycerol lipase